MTQKELLERTRTLMSQSGLVEGFGLGRTWAIVSSCADWMAAYPQQRYVRMRDKLRERWPEDVHELQIPKPNPEFIWHLCLRLDSEAMEAFLSRSIDG
jgi:hypothetical protein